MTSGCFVVDRQRPIKKRRRAATLGRTVPRHAGFAGLDGRDVQADSIGEVDASVARQGAAGYVGLVWRPDVPQRWCVRCQCGVVWATAMMALPLRGFLWNHLTVSSRAPFRSYWRAMPRNRHGSKRSSRDRVHWCWLSSVRSGRVCILRRHFRTLGPSGPSSGLLGCCWQPRCG